MPAPFFAPGWGPSPVEKGLTVTFFAPSDTNSTTNLITQGMPMMLPTAPNGYNAVRPAANAKPDLVCITRQERPNGQITCRIVGTGFVEEIDYSNSSVPAGKLQVVADGAGKWTLVTLASATGIGEVLTAAGGKALVLFR